ncbi:MAG: hypothetical protein JWM34_2214 [Ilumatobacteraceae bacterium]|nr:hypothetical protein [Ilumatobacteraceae bacterium]
MRFELAFTPLNRTMFVPFGMGPKQSWIDVGDTEVVVRMGIGFHATIPLSSISAVSPSAQRPISRGVHGWRGRWLVNASADGILTIDIEPRVRGWVTGFPVRVRQLLVSVVDPAGLQRALMSAPRSPQP